MISKQRRNLVGKKPRSIDHAFRINRFVLGIFFVADTQAYADGFARRLQRNHARVGNDARALIRGHAGVAVNQFFGGDNSGGRNLESRHTPDKRLAGANLNRPDDAQALNAVLLPALFQREEFFFLVRIDSDDEFPRMPERNVVPLAEFVREPVTLDAVPRLQRILRIVNPRMIHTAVARAGSHAQLRKLLDKKNVLPAMGNSLRDGAAN